MRRLLAFVHWRRHRHGLGVAMHVDQPCAFCRELMAKRPAVVVRAERTGGAS
jgi:hypothetical protein